MKGIILSVRRVILLVRRIVRRSVELKGASVWGFLTSVVHGEVSGMLIVMRC